MHFLSTLTTKALAVFCAFFLFSHLNALQTIYIAPFLGCDPKVMFYNENGLSDGCAKPYSKLREALERQGYRVKFIDGQKKLNKRAIVISFNNISADLLSALSNVTKSKKRFLFVFEPPVVDRNYYADHLEEAFDKVFIMLDDYVDNKKYYKFHYPQPSLASIAAPIPFSDKKFCALIARNKKSTHPSELYSKRVSAIRFFEEHHKGELDLFGPGWKEYSSWKGTVDSKWSTLCRYKFCICYENMHQQNGYITEKIFDCLVARCVPIYWGASNIEEYVPSDCFVDRRLFGSNDELYAFLEAMDEETHERYLKSAEVFLASSACKKFSIDSFIKLVIKHLSR